METSIILSFDNFMEIQLKLGIRLDGTLSIDFTCNRTASKIRLVLYVKTFLLFYLHTKLRDKSETFLDGNRV